MKLDVARTKDSWKYLPAAFSKYTHTHSQFVISSATIIYEKKRRDITTFSFFFKEKIARGLFFKVHGAVAHGTWTLAQFSYGKWERR